MLLRLEKVSSARLCSRQFNTHVSGTASFRESQQLAENQDGRGWYEAWSKWRFELSAECGAFDRAAHDVMFAR